MDSSYVRPVGLCYKVLIFAEYENLDQGIALVDRLSIIRKDCLIMPAVSRSLPSQLTLVGGREGGWGLAL